MHLSTATQNDTATLIAKWVRKNATAYAAVATNVDQAGCPAAAVVAITRYGSPTCTAKVAVYPNRIVYASKLGAHVARPTNAEDAGRIVGGLLSLEED